MYRQKFQLDVVIREGDGGSSQDSNSYFGTMTF